MDLPNGRDGELMFIEISKINLLSINNISCMIV